MTAEPPPNVKVRADFMAQLNATLRGWGVSGAEVARRLGSPQPRINRLMNEDADCYSLDALVILADKAGLDVAVTLKKRRAGQGSKAQKA